MKAKNNRRSARVSPRKVSISNCGKGLTTQAGLIPVVKYLQQVGLVSAIKEGIDHKRKDNALYDCVVALFLTVVAIIGGGRTASSVQTVWSDGVLR